jgi:RNA polymerase sigma-70 factor (ECF subfamily)
MPPERTPPVIVFEELVKTEGSFVRRCLEGCRVPAADLDDASQEVFLVASRRLTEIDGFRTRAFLRGVAMRVAATRRRTVTRRREVLSDTLDDQAGERLDPERLTELKLARGRFEEILRVMTHETRDVFRLVELEECSVSSVARRLGIPIGTASSRLRSARSELTLAARRVAAGEAWRAAKVSTSR